MLKLRFGIRRSARVLEAMQKGIDLGEASLALKILKQAGIATSVYLLFGTPPESL